MPVCAEGVGVPVCACVYIGCECACMCLCALGVGVPVCLCTMHWTYGMHVKYLGPFLLINCSHGNQ